MFDDPSDSRVRVKICGITNERDALAAIECGADALGFNLFPNSPRFIDIAREAPWLARLPLEICKVAIVVNPTADDAARVAALPFIDLLQLHGNESPKFCAQLAKSGVRFAKAIHLPSDAGHDNLGDYCTSLFVLDSISAGKFGGTGQVFPWSRATEFVQAHPKLRVILAGGLGPENVRRAVEEVRPFGVDVTTGVERSKGQKDHARMREFVAEVRSFRP